MKTEEQIIEQVKAIDKLIEDKKAEREDVLQSAAYLAHLKVGDRIKYKHRKSNEAVVKRVKVAFGLNRLTFRFIVSPVLKDGSTGSELVEVYNWTHKPLQII